MTSLAPEHKTLTETLRERTWALHTQAERSGIINDILRNKADRRGYALLLRNVLPAYVAMERALDAGRDRIIYLPFANPSLYRAPRIVADLEALQGGDWQRELPLLPQATLYADRVAESAKGDGSRLIAHAYVRYFGDLSGGQVLKRMLGKTLGLSAAQLTFYEFPDIADANTCKTSMREMIDGELARNFDHEPVIGEALRAFEHNIAVSTAIQGMLARTE
jgi:heme oxygenase